jgi:hypothetical protein
MRSPAMGPGRKLYEPLVPFCNSVQRVDDPPYFPPVASDVHRYDLPWQVATQLA